MDLIELLKRFNTTPDAFTFLIHHLGGMVAFAPSLLYKKFLQMVMLIVTTEASTPLVNLRWFLTVLGHEKNSVLYILNGVAMMAVFATVRVLVVPLFIYFMLKRDRQSFDREQTSARAFFYLTTICMWIMNARWFSMMINALLSMLTKSKQQQEDAAAEAVEKK